MTDHLVVDVSHQPARIRCLRCGFVEDLQLPVAIRAWPALTRRLVAAHRACQLIPTTTTS